MGEREVERLLGELDSQKESPDDAELRGMARSATGAARPVARAPSPRLRWGLAVAAALLVGSGFGFGVSAWKTPEGSAGTKFAGLGFLPAKGWTVIQSEAAGPTAARAIAANVPLLPGDDLRGLPRATVASLPENGILIFATFAARGDPTRADFVNRELPLSIDGARAVARLFRLRASVGAYNIDARIYFGSASPSPETVNLAQRQLNRLVVASEDVTIVARSTVLNGVTPARLFGSVASGKADEQVTIEVKECGPHAPFFRQYAAVRTVAGGSWSTEVFVRTNAAVRATWGEAESAPIAIFKRPGIQLRRNGARRFLVGVSALTNFYRKRLTIQRLDQRLGRWTALKSVVLTETGATSGFIWSSSRFELRVPRGTVIRAVLPLAQTRPCYVAGYSNLIRT